MRRWVALATGVTFVVTACDDADTAQWRTVLAFDLETGEQIIDSTLGMGDPATDDFSAGYSESEIGIRAITETDLYVQGDAASRFDLAAGDGEEYVGHVPSTGLPDSLRADIRRVREAAGGAQVVFPLGIPR